tara:strand:- start:13 stop:378 length:366 start_codon:yes stop_codon:yes gene_type:complete
MTTKRHWKKEHYRTVPIDLWELLRALTAQFNRDEHDWKEGPPKDPDSLIPLTGKRGFLKMVEYHTQYGSTKLDAYRIYGNDEHKLTIGIRWGDEPGEYSCQLVTREIADLFDLDPLGWDNE